MDNEELLDQQKSLERKVRLAQETKSPFSKAIIAEEAIGQAVGILSELVKREVSRNGK